MSTSKSRQVSVLLYQSRHQDPHQHPLFDQMPIPRQLSVSTWLPTAISICISKTISSPFSILTAQNSAPQLQRLIQDCSSCLAAAIQDRQNIFRRNSGSMISPFDTFGSFSAMGVAQTNLAASFWGHLGSRHSGNHLVHTWGTSSKVPGEPSKGSQKVMGEPLGRGTTTNSFKVGTPSGKPGWEKT